MKVFFVMIASARGHRGFPSKQDVGTRVRAELVGGDLAVVVGVRALDHLHELRVRHGLAELLRHALEVAERDVARLVVVEEVEHLLDVLAPAGVAWGAGGARGGKRDAAARVSLSDIFAVIMSRNSSKSMEPSLSLSMSPIIW